MSSPASAFSLAGQRIALTQADAFMGPALNEVLLELGADLTADTGTLTTTEEVHELLARCGELDALVINLAMPAPRTAAQDVDDTEWRAVFTSMVDPLQRLVAAALPAMIQRQHGKIVVMGSASAMRGMPLASSYSAARGAQLSYAQSVGVEVARHGVNVNVIAQHYVDNPTYFPPAVQENPKFQARLKADVPLGRLVSAREDAMFAAYLCSDAANCFVGQVFPVCGGWVAR